MLSGGQRQRLSLARAFLKDARIVVLDEPTTGLDAQTEADVLSALRRLMAGRTTIIIAHHLHTVRYVDQIIVLQGGALIQTGTHDQLLQQDGLYRQLYNLQYQPQMQPAEVP
jgi:ABC-type multidrug transport system fused ATPase/permease subunit